MKTTDDKRPPSQESIHDSQNWQPVDHVQYMKRTNNARASVASRIKMTLCTHHTM